MLNKGQTEAVSAILITGIVIGMVGSMYVWGLPLIQKSRDSSVIESSETLMLLLDQKIKSVASSGGRENVKITGPGILRFSGDKLTYGFSTDGTIYAINADIALGRTTNCESSKSGIFGQEEPSVLCVVSYEIEEGTPKYQNDYTLSYRELVSNLKTYKIVLQGGDSQGGQDRTVVIQNNGVTETLVDGKNIITINVGIRIE